MRMLIAGGGTGGHLFPGIAVAEEVSTRHPKNEVVFVGTQRGLEARVVPAAGYRFEAIHSRGLKGKGLGESALGVLTLPRSFFQSLRLLLKYRPDVVVGVGGYSSGPVVLCAWLLRVPTAVQEQNALPGLTNRLLGRVVDKVFLAFSGAAAFFPPDKVRLVGNPIRRQLVESLLQPHPEQAVFTVLVFGGSLGAKALNRCVLEALPHLESAKAGLRFIHQTGKAEAAAVSAGYAALGFDAQVSEFIDDMAGAYGQASLVVCRAGATTVAELAVCKKASVLVPYPFATDDHQALNAQALVEAGAALMFREATLDGLRLAECILALKNDPERRQKMERAAGALGRPEAAKELADGCVELMLKRWGPKGRVRKGEVKP